MSTETAIPEAERRWMSELGKRSAQVRRERFAQMQETPQMKKLQADRRRMKRWNRKRKAR